jgi:hypothetical protein
MGVCEEFRHVDLHRGVGYSCDELKMKRKAVSIDGHEDVPPSDETALRKAVSQQPVSVAICASQLQFYASGTNGSKA